MFLIETFGYKHGDPEAQGAHLVIDVRHLWNPYNDERLRPLDGTDSRVRNTLMSRGDSRTFMGFLTGLVEDLGKRSKSDHVRIKIGCTGGRHRSVSVAIALQDALRGNAGGREVEVRHRDLARE